MLVTDVAASADTALSKEEAGRELAAGASVSLGLGPWSPSSTWLSRLDSLPREEVRP